MPAALFRFYAELNALLPAKKRFQDNRLEFKGRQSVKHLIESQGVPHTQVDLILANGRSVDFLYLPGDGDLISVYPVFETFDISPLIRLRPLPLREIRFVLDGHLGRLAGYLRMLGFDVLYRNDFTDEALVLISEQEIRILLTRDVGLLKRSQVTHGYLLSSLDSKKQLAEVVRIFCLNTLFKPFTRCITCNGLLQKISKQDILDQLQPKTRLYFDEFSQCLSCGKIYWKGSHMKKMQQLIGWLKEYPM